MSHWYMATMEEIDHRPLHPDKFQIGDRTWLDFCKGEPIFDWGEDEWCAVTHERFEGHPDDALWNALWIPIYSARLREALAEVGIGGIQYLPIRVYHMDGSLVPGYAIANVLNCLNLLDLKESEYYPFSEPVPEHRGLFVDLRKRVLRKEAVVGYDILRPKEYPTDLYVSERFKQVFVRGRFSGYAFRRLRRS